MPASATSVAHGRPPTRSVWVSAAVSIVLTADPLRRAAYTREPSAEATRPAAPAWDGMVASRAPLAE